MNSVEFLKNYCTEHGLPEPSYAVTMGVDNSNGRKYCDCECSVEGFIPGKGSSYEAPIEEMCSQAAAEKAAKKRTADAQNTARESAAADFLRQNNLEDGWSTP